MADGFHIDGDGNLWIGSTSTSFDSSAPFYVETDGTIQASSGTIGGLNLGSNFIASTNFNNTDETGYRLQSDGNAQFYGTLIADSFQGTGGTIGGIVIDTTGIESSNYDASTDTGWRLDNSTGVIDAYDIDINLEASPDTTPTGTQRLNIGDGTIYYYNSDLILSAPQVAITDSSGTPGATSPSLTFTDGTYAQPGFYAQEDNAGQRAEFYMTSGSHDIFHTRSGFNVLYLDATYLSVYDGTGNDGQVLGRTSNGLEWVDSGGSHADSDHTSFSSSGHDHDGDYLTSTDLTTHSSATNPHDNYLQESDHNANNTAHSNFITSADLSTHITNNNNIYNSVVDHTDITANQGGGSAHGMSLAGVNAAVLHVNDNSVHTNHNHNYGLAEDPHGNGEHNEAYITNNNANAHHGNDYAASSHSHAYSSIGHGHSYASTNHNHNYAASDHSHSYAATSHNHAYASSFHTHSSISNHTHSYASLNHNHSGNANINAWMHDDRFLSVNANTVPGLNVVNRLNPVTANFNEGYVDRLVESNPDKAYRDSFSSMKRKTFRITAQDVEQALKDDGIDTDDVAWLIDRLYYVDPWLKDESAEKQAHGSRGLMNGELEAVLVQAIKDMSAKIDILQDRITTLEG